MPSFALGLGPSEFPVQTGLTQAAVAVVLGRGGGLRGWQGKVGLTAHGVAALGLAVAARRARRSGDVLDAALVEGLGANDRARITEASSPPPQTALTRRQQLLPDWRLRRRYRSGRDISYGEFGVHNRLDVW